MPDGVELVLPHGFKKPRKSTRHKASASGPKKPESHPKEAWGEIAIRPFCIKADKYSIIICAFLSCIMVNRMFFVNNIISLPQRTRCSPAVLGNFKNLQAEY